MPEKKIEIALKLSESDWAEVYYAIVSKKAYVKEGHYPGQDNKKWSAQLNRLGRTLQEQLRQGHYPGQDNKKWSAQLNRLGRTLQEQLRKNKVTY